MAVGNVTGYCRILLKPENAERIRTQRVVPGEARITVDRIRSLLVRAMGISTLARNKVKEHLEAEHGNKFSQTQSSR
jgi:hypothetical protein